MSLPLSCNIYVVTLFLSSYIWWDIEINLVYAYNKYTFYVSYLASYCYHLLYEVFYWVHKWSRAGTCPCCCRSRWRCWVWAVGEAPGLTPAPVTHTNTCVITLAHEHTLNTRLPHSLLIEQNLIELNRINILTEHLNDIRCSDKCGKAR